jgi:hypothetical protein
LFFLNLFFRFQRGLPPAGNFLLAQKVPQKVHLAGAYERPPSVSKNSLTAMPKTFAMAFTRHAQTNALQLKQNFETPSGACRVGALCLAKFSKRSKNISAKKHFPEPPKKTMVAFAARDCGWAC